MGMTLKELLTKGEGTPERTGGQGVGRPVPDGCGDPHTLLEERGIKVLDNEAEEDASLDVDSIIAEVENAEANSDELGIGDDGEEEQAEENPADLKAAMDELLDDPVKNYLKQIGQIPLLSERRAGGRAEPPHPCRCRGGTSFRRTASSTARRSTSRRTAPASRSKKTRTAGATPRTSTRTAMRSPARTPREKAAEEKAEEESRTAP